MHRRSLPYLVAENQRDDRRAGGNVARSPMAPVPSLARNLHRRTAGTTERAGSRASGGAPFLRLVRGDHSGAGRGSGGLPGPFPREPQFVLPGEPFPGGQAGGNRARRRRGRDGARFVRGRGLIFAGARPALPPGDGGGIGRGGRGGSGLQRRTRGPRQPARRTAHDGGLPRYAGAHSGFRASRSATRRSRQDRSAEADRPAPAWRDHRGGRPHNPRARSGYATRFGLRNREDDAGRPVPADVPFGDGGAAESVLRHALFTNEIGMTGSATPDNENTPIRAATYFQQLVRISGRTHFQGPTRTKCNHLYPPPNEPNQSGAGLLACLPPPGVPKDAERTQSHFRTLIS